MTKISRKRKDINRLINYNSLYKIDDAIEFLKKFSSKKFEESVDLSINLNIDIKNPEHFIKSSIYMPNGLGKIFRVAVFAQGDKLIEAENAGADLSGFEDLFKEIKNGNLNFDIVISTPDSMNLVKRLGKILGPRGLMPNIKMGTITNDVSKAVLNAKSGQVYYKTDKYGIIHCKIGKITFSCKKLLENINVLIFDLKKNKPISVKGNFFKKMFLSTTMGPSLSIDISTLIK
ncbi:50S ribosomal protein L1 [Candidatus Legionella polyplacis]|uniref:Large ribosomal subunit protein uL1 n=1 Tax=Candidatus Legionella polyplacis TaxID=2005262 RepID=A0ABZ2GW76_9GAMM